MTTIDRLLDKKGHDVISISPKASVLDAIKLLAEREIGAVVVVDADKMVGILSERDYARQVILKGRSSESTKVEQIMTSPAISTEPSASIETCMSIMSEKKFRHLPVVENGQLLGIVSMGDIVRSIIAEQSDTIAQLERYVAGDLS